MKKSLPMLPTILKKYSVKVIMSLLLISGLLIQNATAQPKKREAQKRGEVHQKAVRHNNSRGPKQHASRPATPNRSVQRKNNGYRPGNTPNRSVQRNPVRHQVNRAHKRPVYNAHNPNWRYTNLPRRNSIRTTFPSGYRVINYGGLGYRYYHGVFYRPQNNRFVVVAPPVGIYINVLPIGYSRIYVNNYPYYYYNGTYYDYRNNNYIVVSPPVGAIVESLPDGYQTLTINGETYYTADGAQYRPLVQDNGEIWYEVIKAN